MLADARKLCLSVLQIISESMKPSATCVIKLPTTAGKSFLMTHIIEAVESEGRCVAVTATTGIAAEPLHGTTLHRLLGAGMDNDLDFPARIQAAAFLFSWDSPSCCTASSAVPQQSA